MRMEEVKREIERENSLESWARACTNHFPGKIKRMLYEEIDNVVLSGSEEEITSWCQENKVFDEITESEIEEIWEREHTDEREPIRLNGKYV